MTKAEAEAIAREEERAMEVRRDIRMLIFLGVMVFLFISALGYGGMIGKAVSSVMFGLFGVPAYIFPLFVSLVVVFVISNLGKRTLPARTAALIGLFVCACTAFEILSGEVSAAGKYDPALIDIVVIRHNYRIFPFKAFINPPGRDSCNLLVNIHA